MGTVFKKQKHLAEHQLPKQLHQLILPSTFRMKCLLTIIAIAAAISLAKGCDLGKDCMVCQNWVQTLWDGVKDVDVAEFTKVASAVCGKVPWHKECQDIVKALTPLWTKEIADWVEAQHVNNYQVCQAMEFCAQ